MTELAPAILTNDVSDFRKQYSELLPLSHYYSKLHIDFGDGEFVPKKTVMPADITFFRTNKTISMAHLMVYNPQLFFKDCKAAGFTYVLFHYEAFKNEEEVQPVINEAEALGLIPGLVINPGTPLTKIAKFIYRSKLIQIMGVNPGAQGQKFIPETINKVRELRSLSKNVIISVDGGVKVGIARDLAHAGADILIIGSAIAKSEDEEMALMALKLDIET